MTRIFAISIAILLFYPVTSEPEYKWKYVTFSEEMSMQVMDNNKENVIITGISYDPNTRFLCAGFPAVSLGSDVTIGCFDTDKYPKGSSPVFDPFPSLWDNGLPVRIYYVRE